MKRIPTLFVLLVMTYCVNAQQLNWSEDWANSDDTELFAMEKTSDGGFLLGGYSDDNAFYGDKDYWVIKIDASGDEQWSQNYGGYQEDVLNVLRETSDGGFILGGYSYSYSGVNDVSNNYGMSDYWVVKIDALGNIEWEKNYGGSNEDELQDLQQTSDGGFILGGFSKSNDGDIGEGENNGSADYWVVKIDALGNIEWEQNFGGTSIDELYAILQSEDGGYILGGGSWSEDGDFVGNYGDLDAWIIKLDAAGNLEWKQNYGGTSSDEISCLLPKSGGDFMIGGYSRSNDIDVSSNYGNADFWIAEIDASGSIEWEQNFGGGGNNFLNDFEYTLDGGMILTGNTTGAGGDVSESFGNTDYWVLKLDAWGEIEWDWTYGTVATDRGFEVEEIENGSFLIGGTTNGYSIEILNVIELDQAIHANAFYDGNGNGILDDGELPLLYQAFSLNPSELWSVSNSDGTTTFYVSDNTYTLQYENNFELWQIGNGPDSYTITTGIEDIDTTFYCSEDAGKNLVLLVQEFYCCIFFMIFVL